MGIMASKLTRKLNRFNVESRAHRVLERDKPIAAPKFESNLKDMQRALELDPQIVDKLNKKDFGLDDRLKNVYVTSKDSFIEYHTKEKSDSTKPLPTSRETPDDFEFGFQEPVRVSRGRCTLRQAMKFITDHQGAPELWTKERIANDYKLKEDVVENILLYFKSFNIHIADKYQRENLLTQSKSKLLKGEDEKPT